MSNPSAPRARYIDPRGHRFGAALSVVILSTALVTGQPVLVAFIAIALAVSSLFGTQYSILGRPWPFVRQALGLGRVEPEHEYPPRFAQALGAIGLTIALGLFVAGLTVAAWVPVVAVGSLQALLAVTGFCLGCRLFFLRWWIPDLFVRVTGGGDATSLLGKGPLSNGTIRRV